MYRETGVSGNGLASDRPSSLHNVEPLLLDESEATMAYEGRQETMIDRYSRSLLHNNSVIHEGSKQSGGLSTRNARLQKSDSVLKHEKKNNSFRNSQAGYIRMT